MTVLNLARMLLARIAMAPDPTDGSFWMPPQVSTVAHSVDWLFNFILAISVFFFILITLVMVIFVLKYRRREGQTAQASPSHNLPLELTWTAIPLVLVIIIFFFGFKGFLDMATPPANAYEVMVEGQKWNWSFTYPNGYVDQNLHVPVDRPVQLVMSSADVIHSLYVPAFRIKMDVVPGRYSQACVHPPGEFETWLEKASNFLETMSPVDAGRKLFQVRGCTQCHSMDGSAKTGPTLLGVFGRTEQMADGTSLTVDENYIRESILEPNARVVAGFEPVMPTYQGRLKNEEILAIIEYLKAPTGASQEE